MEYISTRGEAAPTDFRGVALAGLAPDGGLYMPRRWPAIAPPDPADPYGHTVCRIVSAFAGGALGQAAVTEDVVSAYRVFAHPAVAPLRPLGGNLHLLELHHGPTLAFKDIAMRYLACLYDRLLREDGRRLVVLCATSGDTGGAAAAAFAGLGNVDLVILHPHRRVAPRQRLFMTTTAAGNVHNLAVEGDFDACQAIVKSCFADPELRGKLSGVNSINWTRIVAQAAYFATARAAFGPDQPPKFIVPTGNFGNAFAGWVGARCGLVPDFDCVLAVNDNDAMLRLLGGGELRRAETVPTPSPAMDIQSPSNFERLLHVVCDGNGKDVAAAYRQCAEQGHSSLPEGAAAGLAKTGFSVVRVGGDRTLSQMRDTFERTGELVCPHTAVGLAAAGDTSDSARPHVVLATAHAAKFPETVAEATGREAPLPQRCAGLDARPERLRVVPAETGVVSDLVRALI